VKKRVTFGYLLLALFLLCCGRHVSYSIEPHYEGPVVIVFSVPGGVRTVGGDYAIGPSGIALVNDAFQNGAAEIYERNARGKTAIDLAKLGPVRSSAYVACDAVGKANASIQSVSFFVGDLARHLNWQSELEKARLSAVAYALTLTKRPAGAACALDEATAVK
jgi:hypothetical protein